MFTPSRHAAPFLAALVLSASAVAQEADVSLKPEEAKDVVGEPVTGKDRLLFTTFWVYRHAPLGVDAQGSLVYRHLLGAPDQDILWRTRFVSAAVTGTYNPAEWSVQGYVEYEPIAVLQLKALYELRGYPGGYDEIQSFSTLTPAIDDASIAARGANNEHYASSRHTLRFEAKPRIGFGPIGIQNTFAVVYGRLDARAGDITYWDPGAIILAPTNGLVLSNELAVVYSALKDKLTLGALYTFLAPLGLGAENQVHRAGALAAYTFYDSPRAWVNRPTLFVLTQFHLVQRDRAGFFPTIVAGFSTQTDLFIQR